jgi:hypothetical protein
VAPGGVDGVQDEALAVEVVVPVGVGHRLTVARGWARCGRTE